MGRGLLETVVLTLDVEGDGMKDSVFIRVLTGPMG